MVRRAVLLANACGLAVGLAVLTGCGGDTDLGSGIDRSVDRIQRLEDDVELLERIITTSTTAPPPPATLATQPPTTRDPDAPSSTTSTAAPAAIAIADASEAAILELVGDAAWDPGLPIPADCVRDGSFTPSGEAGGAGGVLACTVEVPSPQVEAYYRSALTRNRFPFTADAGGSSFSFAIGSQATITGRASGDRTTLTIEQRFS